MKRIYIPLQADEKNALYELSKRERRDPRAQAAILIRRELERLGLVQSQSQKSEVITNEAQFNDKFLPNTPF